MSGRPLHVEQHHAVRPQQFDRGPQRDLRRVRDDMEHRLAREQPADAHAVEAADQLVPDPGLDAVRPSQLVQPAVRVARTTRRSTRAAAAGPRTRASPPRTRCRSGRRSGAGRASATGSDGTRRAGECRADRATTTRARRRRASGTALGRTRRATSPVRGPRRPRRCHFLPTRSEHRVSCRRMGRTSHY